MPTHNHLLHLQMRNRIRDHGLTRQVGGRQHIGDVAMHEDVAWLEAQEGGFRDPAVGAADPEDLRGLAFAELGHQVWVVAADVRGPVLVFGEGILEGGVYLGMSAFWERCIYVRVDGRGLQSKGWEWNGRGHFVCWLDEVVDLLSLREDGEGLGIASW